ncbi:MAG TPA: hypothetical protein VFT04_04215 [Gemmatimonadales bacterium]|nr:hypothetical protein [Gemmatimonadales bacterium]
MTNIARAALFAAAIIFPAPPHAAAQSSTIRVTISGGPHAGTYEMAEQCDVQANAYPAMHIMAFTVGAARPKSPSTMEFFLASGKGKPDGFVVAVVFPIEGGEQPRYEIFAIPPELAPGNAPPLRGRGTVAVKQTATGGTASFRGQTKDGVKMEGTVECRSRSS